MKTKKLILLTVILCAAFFAYNCGSGGASKMIAKKWQFESMKSDAMDKQMAAVKQQMDTTKDSATRAMLQSNLKMVDEMMSSMKSMTLEYKADGTYEEAATAMGQSQTEKGKWSVSADGKKLMQTPDGKDKTDTLDINTISDDQLVLGHKEQTGGNMSMTMKAVK